MNYLGIPPNIKKNIILRKIKYYNYIIVNNKNKLSETFVAYTQ